MSLVTVLTLLCCCCVLRPRAQQLFPAGRHWIYSYEALVRTGALLPAEAHSQWELRGTLAVHSLDAHTAALRLADLHASAYNGPRDSASSAAVPPLEPVPTEAARYLHAPFLVHYTTDGAEALSVPVAEPLWAINVKRSIASVLQLRPELLSERASLTSERGLLGLCRDVEYSVVNNTEYVYLRKNIDGTRCELTPLSWSSAPLFSCGDGSHEGQREYAASTTREYTLARRPLEGRLELEHVMSSRRLYVQPHSATAEAHNVYQYQAYRLLSSEAVTWPELEPPSRLVRRALTFEHDTCDLTQGRAAASADQQDALRQVHSLLDRLVSTLDASEGPAAGAPPPHSRLLTQLYYTSYRLRLDTLQRLYDDIAIGTSYQLETKRNMFLELLPQIGTAASAHFLRDLIVSHRVRPLACLKLLAVLPFYARHSDETLLRELESLLMLGDTHDLSVRRAAALSFATLVQRTRAAARCSSETHELYARRFLDLFADATDHDQRMLYLQALDNLQPVSTFTFLSSLITGEGGGGSEQYSRHLRSLALWALLPLGERHAADTYRLLWPLLVNRSEHLELRAVSLAALLAAQPSETRLLTLYWYMQAEADLHLRHFFYTTLVSLRGTTYPCYARLARVARLVVRFLRAPASPAWTTANHLLDYRDAESMFGGMAHLYLIGHPVSGAPAVLHLTVNNYAAGRSLNQVTLHLKLQGLDDRLAAHLANATTAVEPSFERLVQLLESANVKVPVADDLHIEIIVKVQGKSVFCHHFDNNNFNNMINGNMRHAHVQDG